MVASRISRTREFGGRQRDGCAPAERTDESTGRSYADVRPEQKLRLRIGNGVSHRAGKLVRRTGADRSRRRPRFRTGPDERLERARHSGVGISAAGTVSGQKLRDEHIAMGGDARSARKVHENAY